MRQYLSLLIILSLTFAGCKSYVQVFETNSDNTPVKQDQYVYENDTLKITYSFWSPKGLMVMNIYNKSARPIYVDWKKSSYIDNSVKLNYWIDEEKKFGEYYGRYYYSGPIPSLSVAGISTSAIIKVERVTFIPPNSNYTRSQFYILPLQSFMEQDKKKYSEVPRNDNPKKKTKVYSTDYSRENTPLIFRNFMTVSFTEDFASEFYVDNEFYISNVKLMDLRHFSYYLDADGKAVKFAPVKKETSFYLGMLDEWRIQ